MSQEPQNLVNLAKLAEDIKQIKESLAKQEIGANGFTESQGAAKNEEAKTAKKDISQFCLTKMFSKLTLQHAKS